VRWWYKGDKNKIQGPFPAKWMQAWMGDGHFQDTLQVATHPEGRYNSIRDLYPNRASAFRSDPLEDLKMAESFLTAEIDQRGSERGA
jgi:hypothetical protein